MVYVEAMRGDVQQRMYCVIPFGAKSTSLSFSQARNHQALTANPGLKTPPNGI